MNNKIIKIFTILSSFTIIFLIIFILYEKTNIFTTILNKSYDLTKQKYRKKYIISENLDITSYIKDEKTLLIFWATWCPYCVNESDALNEYIKSNPNNSIIIVSHDTEIEELKKYLDENNYNWFVIIDKDKTIRESIDPGSKGIPSSYLINNQKNILNFHKGGLSLEQFNSFFNEVKI